MIIQNNNLEQFIRGCVRCDERNGYLFPIRFTQSQSEHFSKSDFLYPRSKMTAGVRLEFYTNTQKISFDAILMDTSRNYYSFDVYVDGILSFNFSKENAVPNTEINISFELKEGFKKVQIYFPCLFETGIKNFCIDDFSEIQALETGIKILFFGDSITHGYATKCTSLTYANILSRTLNADSLNQAVAGDVFNADNLDKNLPFDPEIIFVAYGTNDWWSGRDISITAKKYLDKLTDIYRDTKIFLILPIYRLDCQEKQDMAVVPFLDFREVLKGIGERYKNISVVDSIDFVPHIKDFFEDEFLHPNDLGFSLYADALTKHISKR